jgi:hypothetical protein
MLFEQIKEIVNNTKTIPKPPTKDLYFEFNLTGNRQKFEKLYFERRKLLTCYSLYIYKSNSVNKNILDTYIKLLNSVLTEISWAISAHINYNDFDNSSYTTVDLFASETAQTLSEITHILKNVLPIELIQKIKHEIENRVIKPFLTQKFDWETLDNNWNAVCNGCIGISIILSNMSEEVKIKSIKRINNNLLHYINSFKNDGICIEGMEYFNYGFGYFVYYYSILKKYGYKFLKVNTKKLKEIAEFPYKVQMTKNDYVNFSDVSPNVLPHTGLMSYLNKNFKAKIPYLKNQSNIDNDHCFRYAQISRDLLWTNKKLLKKTLTPYKNFEKYSGWVINRNNNYSLIFKGGNNNESHNHNDVGNFVFSCDGQMIITDLGSGIYTKDYFNKNNLDDHIKTAFHNVPIINNTEQFSDVLPVKIIEKNQNIYELNLSNYYNCSVIRKFTMSNNGWTICDKFFNKNKFNIINETIILQNKPVIQKNNVIIYTKNQQIILSSNVNVKCKKYKTKNHLAHSETYYILKYRLFNSNNFFLKIKIA